MNNHEFRISNGAKVKCRITGFTGIVTSSSTHLNMCDRYFVTPPMDKDGRLPEGYWIDDFDLIVFDDVPALENKAKSSPVKGGAMSRVK